MLYLKREYLFLWREIVYNEKKDNLREEQGMLTILIGRAGSGKSNMVLQQIEARRHERGQILLVPEHTSHEAEMDLLHHCGATASRSAEVLSFQRLARREL